MDRIVKEKLREILCPPTFSKKGQLNGGDQFIWLDETKVPNFFHYFRNENRFRKQMKETFFFVCPPPSPLAHAPTVPVLYRGMRYLGVPLLDGYPDCHDEVAEATILLAGAFRATRFRNWRVSGPGTPYVVKAKGKKSISLSPAISS